MIPAAADDDAVVVAACDAQQLDFLVRIDQQHSRDQTSLVTKEVLS